jgi:hypothetical protein
MHKTSRSVIGICARVIDQFWDKVATSDRAAERRLLLKADIWQRTNKRTAPERLPSQRSLQKEGPLPKKRP